MSLLVDMAPRASLPLETKARLIPLITLRLPSTSPGLLCNSRRRNRAAFRAGHRASLDDPPASSQGPVTAGAAAIPSPVASAVDLQSAARDLDKLLSAASPDAEARAVQLVSSLRDAGVLRGFGRARLVPKRAYTMEDLRINKIDTTQFLAPADTTLDGVRRTLWGAAAAGLAVAVAGGAMSGEGLAQVIVVVGLVLGTDQVANSGGGEALIVDAVGRVINGSYGERVAMHEAGHFLVAYLMGAPFSFFLFSLKFRASFAYHTTQVA
jgi:hypothetical protein